MAAALVLVPGVLFLHTFFVFAAAAAPGPDRAVARRGTTRTNGGVSAAHRGDAPERRFRLPGRFISRQARLSMTAVLVNHPRGDVLIDTGFGRQVDQHFQMMPFFFRAATSYERRFIDGGGFVTGVAQSSRVSPTKSTSSRGGAYLGFAKSHDVYGDGSVVIVPAPGHTPGSVIVFLALPNGRRYALVGDLAWQREGITLREERPWLQRMFADADAPAASRTGSCTWRRIAERFPELVLAPAHDQRGFEGMATLRRN